MSAKPTKILVLHTAFIGDVVLTLPLVQRLHASIPRSEITFVAIPLAAGVLQNHPAIKQVITYDKHGKDAGAAIVFALAKRLRSEQFDIAVIPHRSFRSAAIGWLSRTPRRIGFSTSAAPWLFTNVVKYDKNSHEIDRNLSLLQPLGTAHAKNELPSLYPSDEDKEIIDRFMFLYESANPRHGLQRLVAIAPGSVWNTKRWPREHFIELGKMLAKDGFAVFLVGGKEDVELCERIAKFTGARNVMNTAGKLSLLQSAELIRRCKVLVSNDSAPMHLAVGVRTPVVAIFGATAPQFGFAPRGAHDEVVQIDGLSCRPCAIHGGEKCPIETFVCMKDLKPELVYTRLKMMVDSAGSEVQ